MPKVIPHSISMEQNTKAFEKIPPFAARARRNFVVKYAELVLMEVSFNMLETSEKYVLLIGFWGSLGFTLYQLWILYFSLRELWTPVALGV